jgi:hypothetical protein
MGEFVPNGESRMAAEGKPILREILEHPIPSFFVMLVLGALALSGRFSVTATQILLFAALLVGLYGLYECLQLRGARFFVSAMTLIAAVGGLAIWARPETVPTYFGELIPGRHLLFSADHPAENIIEIGDSNARFGWAGEPGKPVLNLYGSPLTIETIRGSVKVSTEIRDAHGKMLVELVRNQWRISPAPNTFDRNYTQDALEVRNAEGRVVLQIKVLPDRVQLQGEWRGSDGEAARIVKGPGPDGQIGGLIVIRPTGIFLPSDPKISQIFLYPSDAHFGEMREAK